MTAYFVTMIPLVEPSVNSGRRVSANARKRQSLFVYKTLPQSGDNPKPIYNMLFHLIILPGYRIEKNYEFLCRFEFLTCKNISFFDKQA